jgi:hypothetical protein
MEIYINPEDIEEYAKNYEKVNPNYKFFSYTKNAKQTEHLCTFLVNGKECKIRFYIKKNTVKMRVEGKNTEEAHTLLEYIQSNGFDINEKRPEQFVFPCNKEMIDELVLFIQTDFNNVITLDMKPNNRIRITGYNKDYLDITFYPQTSKAMIQGRAFTTYSIVVAFLTQFPLFTFENVIEINNIFLNSSLSVSAIRNEMKTELGDAAYNYLDEALLKSISGSISSLKIMRNSEDYTGCVAGIFKALEGYLKKVLTEKYGYTLGCSTSTERFYMFQRNNGTYIIDTNSNISSDELTQLHRLYSLFKNKRNVYLHSSSIPSTTAIIETLDEAQNLASDILNAIKQSYDVIFN